VNDCIGRKSPISKREKKAKKVSSEKNRHAQKRQRCRRGRKLLSDVPIEKNQWALTEDGKKKVALGKFRRDIICGKGNVCNPKRGANL